MTHVRRLLFLVLSLVLFDAPSSAKDAKPPKETPVYRSFDGKPVDHTCRAETGNLDGLKAALIAHARALIGFKAKMRTGGYSVPKAARTSLDGTSPQAIVDRIKSKIFEIDGRGRPDQHVRTAVLIYDAGAAEGHYSSCVWLISGAGLEAAAIAPLPPHSFPDLLRTSLGVTARAAGRVPVAKKGKRSRADQGTLAGKAAPTSEQTAFTLDDASNVLLPASVREKLVAPRSGKGPPNFNRILVLPAADFGTVPFAALPIGDGKSLVDQAAIVLLPDIDALFASMGVNPPSSLQTFEKSQMLIVGDPDLSQDKHWIFPPLPGVAEEAKQIAQMGKTPPLIGSKASRSNVLDRLKQTPGIIYFATHGLADPVNPMDGSFLALSHGHLFARDIKRLRSRFYQDAVNPIVVMSACQTGLGKIFEGGVFGLARAWHYAGAWQIVMSLWNVDDNATADLMTHFMGYDAESRRYQQSLWTRSRDPYAAVFMHERNRLLSESDDYSAYEPVHGAEFDLRAATIASRKEYPDPSLWAAFVLYGLPTMQSP